MQAAPFPPYPDAIRADAVDGLRAWLDGGPARNDLADSLTTTLGPDGAAIALEALATLAELCTQCALCPLKTSGRCAGLDRSERCFADFVEAAATGDREMALMHGMFLMPPDAAFAALPCAQAFGLALMRSRLRARG